jgi:hypothetical protein
MDKAQVEEKIKGVPQELHRIIDFRMPAMTHPNRVILVIRTRFLIGEVYRRNGVVCQEK